MKAQVSTEFFFFISVMIVILGVASFAALSAQRDMGAENEVRDARRIASLIASEINTAVEIGPGYSHVFSLPGLFTTGANYSVSFEDRYVYVSWNNKTYLLPVIAYNITGNADKGRNTVRNADGVINID